MQAFTRSLMQILTDSFYPVQLDIHQLMILKQAFDLRPELG
jgi:hypothetical protein